MNDTTRQPETTCEARAVAEQIFAAAEKVFWDNVKGESIHGEDETCTAIGLEVLRVVAHHFFESRETLIVIQNEMLRRLSASQRQRVVLPSPLDA